MLKAILDIWRVKKIHREERETAWEKKSSQEESTIPSNCTVCAIKVTSWKIKCVQNGEVRIKKQMWASVWNYKISNWFGRSSVTCGKLRRAGCTFLFNWSAFPSLTSLPCVSVPPEERENLFSQNWNILSTSCEVTSESDDSGSAGSAVSWTLQLCCDFCCCLFAIIYQVTHA